MLSGAVEYQRQLLNNVVFGFQAVLDSAHSNWLVQTKPVKLVVAYLLQILYSLHHR